METVEAYFRKNNFEKVIVNNDFFEIFASDDKFEITVSISEAKEGRNTVDVAVLGPRGKSRDKLKEMTNAISSLFK